QGRATPGWVAAVTAVEGWDCLVNAFREMSEMWFPVRAAHAHHGRRPVARSRPDRGRAGERGNSGSIWTAWATRLWPPSTRGRPGSRDAGIAVRTVRVSQSG